MPGQDGPGQSEPLDVPGKGMPEVLSQAYQTILATSNDDPAAFADRYQLRPKAIRGANKPPARRMRGLPTGFLGRDRLTGRFQACDLMIIAAHPSF